jgi:DNA/RNA endonuclease YhcR with UshA esterase domain
MDTPDDSSGDEINQTASPKKTTKTTTVKVTKVSTPAQKIDLENISTLSIGDKVITQGIVSVEPGVLGTQIFYLSGSGIQIYCNKKEFPDLKIGDSIEVNGTISEASGERRIKITGKDDIKIISQGQTPKIHQISTSEVGEEMIGSLVKIKGEIIEVKSSYIYIDDGSEEAKIYIKASTGITIKDLNIKPGDQLEVTGIISNASGGYRLLPRYATDIKKTGEVKGAYTTATPPNTDSSGTGKYLWAIIIFLIAIIGWLIYKTIIQKNKNKKE